jgi:hypothetical protein
MEYTCVHVMSLSLYDFVVFEEYNKFLGGQICLKCDSIN